ncbi:MAG: ISAs1 family transposase [Pirellulales bacterium]
MLHEVLVMAVCGLLVGGESFYDMEDFALEREQWLRGFLTLPGGIPRHDTFNRIFQALCPRAFAECFARWTQGVRARLRGDTPATGGEVVALDGKALRRARARTEEPRTIVSAWATRQGLALGQNAVAGKSNEITAVPDLLRALELAGCIVTLDALHCQKTTAREIHEADADYLLALKGNQGTTHQEVRAYLDDAILRRAPELVHLETVEKGHGRLETRCYWQSTNLGWFADRAEWKTSAASASSKPCAKSPAAPRAPNAATTSAACRWTSLCFARAVRGHWSIENQLHWSLDVTFDEDRSRARTRHAATNLATLRRIALNLLRARQVLRKVSTENVSAPLSIQTTSLRSSLFDASALILPVILIFPPCFRIRKLLLANALHSAQP